MVGGTSEDGTNREFPSFDPAFAAVFGVRRGMRRYTTTISSNSPNTFRITSETSPMVA